MTFIDLFAIIMLYASGSGHASIPQFSTVVDVVYVQANNAISISLHDANPEDLDLKLTNGVARKINDSTFYVVPQMPTDEFKIKLYYKKVICDLMTVKAIMLEKPKLVVLGAVDGAISKVSLSSLRSLSLDQAAKIPENLQYKIRSFNMTLIDPKGLGIFNKNCQSMEFDADLIQKLQNINVGAKIQINNIFALDGLNNISRLDQSIQLEVVK